MILTDWKVLNDKTEAVVLTEREFGLKC